MAELVQKIDGWNEEKTVHSLMDVAWAMKFAKELQARMPTATWDSIRNRDDAYLVEEIVSSLSGALYDLTKITAFLYDLSAWKPGDRDRIVDGGDHGLMEILTKYGVDGWLPTEFKNLGPEVVTDKAVIDSILLEVKDLSLGPPENRTAIYDVLRKLPKNAMAGRIFDLIEPVTQGDKEWIEFRQEVQELLREL